MTFFDWLRAPMDSAEDWAAMFMLGVIALLVLIVIFMVFVTLGAWVLAIPIIVGLIFVLGRVVIGAIETFAL